jgi:DNA-binding IclR family transcriptional regulator
VGQWIDKDGDLDALTLGLRALAVLADNAPIDVAGFAKLNCVSEEEARKLMQTYEKYGYARRTSHREIYILTKLARDLVGQAGPGERLN